MSVNEMDYCVQGGVCVAPLMPFITSSEGTLTGKLIANEMYQWVRDTVDIPGANSATYQPTSEDIGHLLRVRMHFTDSENNFHSVISKPIGPIGAPTPGAPSYVNAGTYAVNNVNNTIEIPLPDNRVPGNLLLFWLGGAGGSTPNPLPGWTYFNSDIFSNAVIAYRVVDGSEGASVSLGFSGNGLLQGQALQFSGVNGVAPFGVTNTNFGSGTTASNGGITTSHDRSLVFALTQANSNQVIPAPAAGDWAEAAGTANNVSSPFASGSRIVTKFIETAGATGPISVPIASTSWRISMYELISS